MRLSSFLRLAMSIEDAKRILGFPPGSSPSKEEVKDAYKKLAFKFHPDLQGGDKRKMQQINVAKDILDGKTKPKKNYPPPPKGGYGPGPGGVNWEDIFGKGFGGGFKGKGKTKAKAKGKGKAKGKSSYPPQADLNTWVKRLTKVFTKGIQQNKTPPEMAKYLVDRIIMQRKKPNWAPEGTVDPDPKRSWIKRLTHIIKQMTEKNNFGQMKYTPEDIAKYLLSNIIMYRKDPSWEP